MTHPQLDVRPFEAIPSELARQLRADIDRAADEILQELLTAAASDDEVEETRAAIVTGLVHFSDLIEDPRGGWATLVPVFLDLGRRLAREGRSLEEVHRSLRRSARATWRTLSVAVEQLDLDTKTIGFVAEAQFTYMDAVAATITVGYDAEGEGSPDALHRRRIALLTALLTDQPMTAEALAEQAGKARWPVPGMVSAVVLATRDPAKARAVRLLPDGTLVDWEKAQPCLLVPDPEGPGRQRLLEPLLRDWIVTIGPAVPVARAAESYHWARELMSLAERGVVGDDDLIRCAEHVPTLVMFGAKGLLDTMAVTRLAPLSSASPAQRERLSETLLSLLENNFNAVEVGRQLHVHAQTVRYRIRQLEAMFGSDLQDPRLCLEIEMILRTRLSARRKVVRELEAV
ncbi:MAG: helix-turn-helix domain-containing protein [Streptosporangiaceae bacterium]